jgi:hypothetical protein
MATTLSWKDVNVAGQFWAEVERKKERKGMMSGL